MRALFSFLSGCVALLIIAVILPFALLGGWLLLRDKKESHAAKEDMEDGNDSFSLSPPLFLEQDEDGQEVPLT